MHSDKNRMIISTLEDIIYSIELIKKRCKNELNELLSTSKQIMNDIL